jgi:hypothetical protein
MEPARDEPDDAVAAGADPTSVDVPQWSRLAMSRTTAREKRAL